MKRIFHGTGFGYSFFGNEKRGRFVFFAGEEDVSSFEDTVTSPMFSFESVAEKLNNPGEKIPSGWLSCLDEKSKLDLSLSGSKDSLIEDPDGSPGSKFPSPKIELSRLKEEIEKGPALLGKDDLKKILAETFNVTEESDQNRITDSIFAFLAGSRFTPDNLVLDDKNPVKYGSIVNYEGQRHYYLGKKFGKNVFCLFSEISLSNWYEKVKFLDDTGGVTVSTTVEQFIQDFEDRFEAVMSNKISAGGPTQLLEDFNKKRKTGNIPLQPIDGHWNLYLKDLYEKIYDLAEHEKKKEEGGNYYQQLDETFGNKDRLKLIIASYIAENPSPNEIINEIFRKDASGEEEIFINGEKYADADESHRRTLVEGYFSDKIVDDRSAEDRSDNDDYLETRKKNCYNAVFEALNRLVKRKYAEKAAIENSMPDRPKDGFERQSLEVAKVLLRNQTKKVFEKQKEITSKLNDYQTFLRNAPEGKGSEYESEKRKKWRALGADFSEYYNEIETARSGVYEKLQKFYGSEFADIFNSELDRILNLQVPIEVGGGRPCTFERIFDIFDKANPDPEDDSRILQTLDKLMNQINECFDITSDLYTTKSKKEVTKEFITCSVDGIAFGEKNLEYNIEKEGDETSPELKSKMDAMGRKYQGIIKKYFEKNNETVSRIRSDVKKYKNDEEKFKQIYGISIHKAENLIAGFLYDKNSLITGWNNAIGDNLTAENFSENFSPGKIAENYERFRGRGQHLLYFYALGCFDKWTEQIVEKTEEMNDWITGKMQTDEENKFFCRFRLTRGPSIAAIFFSMKEGYNVWNRRNERKKEMEAMDILTRLFGGDSEYARRAGELEDQGMGEYKNRWSANTYDELFKKLENGTKTIKDKYAFKAVVELLIEKGNMRWDDVYFLRLLKHFSKAGFSPEDLAEQYNVSQVAAMDVIGDAVHSIFINDPWQKWKHEAHEKRKSFADSTYGTEIDRITQPGAVRAEAYEKMAEILEAWESGDINKDTDPAFYLGLLLKMFEASRMNSLEDFRWFYIIKGMTAKRGGTGPTLLSSVEVSAALRGHFEKYPFFEIFGNWQYSLEIIQKGAELFRGIDNYNLDPDSHPENRQKVNSLSHYFLQKYIINEYGNKFSSRFDPTHAEAWEKFDPFEDAVFAKFFTHANLQKILVRNSGSRDRLTDTKIKGWLGTFSGNLSMMHQIIKETPEGPEKDRLINEAGDIIRGYYYGSQVLIGNFKISKDTQTLENVDIINDKKDDILAIENAVLKATGRGGNNRTVRSALLSYTKDAGEGKVGKDDEGVYTESRPEQYDPKGWELPGTGQNAQDYVSQVVNSPELRNEDVILKILEKVSGIKGGA